TLDDYLPGGAMPGLKVTDFRQREPKDLETPTQPTAGCLSYDASNVYVAFVCTQPRGDVRARMQKREDLGADAWSACISIPSTIGSAPPSSSRRRSASGDGIITETGGEDSSFDTQWDSRGKLTDDG
ncbi:MAG: hypothetical protein ACHQRO_12640, partial [Vicinamibacteria bacterium]